jgi:DNA replication protein DnaC
MGECMTPEIERLFTATRLPKNHWECSIAQIPSLPYKPLVVDWVDKVKENIEEGKGILLYGKHGSGKSGIAAIMLKAALSKRIGALWVAAEAIYDYRLNQDTILYSDSTSLWDRMMTVPLLVVDDMLVRNRKDQKSQWIEMTLEMLIRRRTDSKLCTIITTNEDLSKIKSEVLALFSILKEATTPINVVGHDFRLNK